MQNISLLFGFGKFLTYPVNKYKNNYFLDLYSVKHL